MQDKRRKAFVEAFKEMYLTALEIAREAGYSASEAVIFAHGKATRAGCQAWKKALFEGVTVCN